MSRTRNAIMGRLARFGYSPKPWRQWKDGKRPSRKYKHNALGLWLLILLGLLFALPFISVLWSK